MSGEKPPEAPSKKRGLRDFTIALISNPVQVTVGRETIIMDPNPAEEVGHLIILDWNEWHKLVAAVGGCRRLLNQE